MSHEALALTDLPVVVAEVLNRRRIWDVHTHLYPPTFGTPVTNRTGRTDPTGLMLWGIDELVTYHYLVAEVFRAAPAPQVSHAEFFRWSKSRQADHIWRYLFVENTPISEACRGVLTTLQRLGLDPNEKTLDGYRAFFSRQDPDEYIDRVMDLAGVSSITMTNAVFDDAERGRWLADKDVGRDPRFKAVLRIDPLLRNFPAAAGRLAEWGYPVQKAPTPSTLAEVRRFLEEWLDRQQAIYVAASLPPEFRYPSTGQALEQAGQTVLEQAVLPVCAARKMPLALMIGARLRTEPALREAGDTSGLADVQTVANLCRAFPANKFLVTMLARENQHELCVVARKFGNLMPFGCWWFLNNPSLIDEITRMRLEMLGTSFIPQHSDARILDQLLYKWPHSRRVIADALADMYVRLAQTGRRITRAEVERDAALLLAGNFQAFLER